jgi:predicted DCC family thiol-disulfide oxidoreductase YuxK
MKGELLATFRLSTDTANNTEIIAMNSEAQKIPGKHVLFYDGVCGLCSHFTQVVIRYDKKGEFAYAPLQSDFARGVLKAHGKNPDDLDTIYVLANYGTPKEMLYRKSSAALYIGKQLNGLTLVLATIASIIPTPIRDWGYDRVASSRYKVFGKYDTCMLPSPDVKERFIQT